VLVRQYIPKKEDITNCSDKAIENFQHKINRRPRKLLNFETPKKSSSHLLIMLNPNKKNAMKMNKIIFCLLASAMLSSCFSKKYTITTQVDNAGSGRRDVFLQGDTIFSKRFRSVDDLAADLINEKIFHIAKESLTKRFRWFYTYYAYTAVYPELNDKGRVPMEKYLNKDEQKFYLQGDISAFSGITGMELKELLDDIESRFMEWYNRSMYEEWLEVILYFTEAGFQASLSAAKDTLFTINEKYFREQNNYPGLNLKDIFPMLDSYFETSRFSNLYAANSQKMDDMLTERTKVVDELLNFSIQYELILPGKILIANTGLREDGKLVWEINMLKFLSDDYTLAAESRKANGWAFAVTLLLLLFAVYSLAKKRK
jgi:hypothetical protein